MAIFQCPRTGENVAMPFEPDPSADSNIYESVQCPACTFHHLLNRSTGKPLSGCI